MEHHKISGLHLSSPSLQLRERVVQKMGLSITGAQKFCNEKKTEFYDTYLSLDNDVQNLSPQTER
jgi:hypothetical protein